MENILKQYRSIKEKYPDATLFFRVGDFYETFDEDAKVVSKHTGITLQEAKRKAGIQYLTSVPANAVDAVLHKLVKAGYKVALCEQLEDPKKNARMVKRGVTDFLKPS